MTTDKNIKILELHNTLYMISDGHIIADIPFSMRLNDGSIYSSKPFEESEDVTGYTRKELLFFLGY